MSYSFKVVFAPQLYTSKLTKIGNRSDIMIIFLTEVEFRDNKSHFATQGPTWESGTIATNIADYEMHIKIIFILDSQSIYYNECESLYNFKLNNT